MWRMEFLTPFNYAFSMSTNLSGEWRPMFYQTENTFYDSDKTYSPFKTRACWLFSELSFDLILMNTFMLAGYFSD